MHCNADDTLLAGSGYTHSVHVSDLETGHKLRVLKNIHEGHINIARFANHMPYLLLTSGHAHAHRRGQAHRTDKPACILVLT
jgi:hypothetical protein